MIAKSIVSRAMAKEMPAWAKKAVVFLVGVEFVMPRSLS